jgi:tetratricopeptide (TPR) repeat protein
MSSKKLMLGGLGLLAAMVVIGPAASLAAMDEPPAKPKIDCTNPANKDKPACAAKHGPMSDDQIYESAYWNAKNGQYKEALAVVAQAQNKDDPRILRVTGFATRKLGDVEGGMTYYREALAINPGDTRTRQYMGEAFLTKGDLTSAREQLGEIEKRCGAGCEDYQKLAAAISTFEGKRPSGS